jgi:chromosome segregation ATPase
MSTEKSNQFGEALLFILGEFAVAEDEHLEHGCMEVYGEDEQGREGSCEVTINDLAQAAIDEIKHLREQLAKSEHMISECWAMVGNDIDLEHSGYSTLCEHVNAQKEELAHANLSLFNLGKEKEKLEKALGNVGDELVKANERVRELESENTNGNAAAELLIWWARKLSNAPNEDLKEVIRIGYKRIVNLANLIGKEQLRKEQQTCSK